VGEALNLAVRPAPGPIYTLADCSASQLRDQYDVVVAHIGDHYGYHGALPARLQEVDVVGVFHDSFIANLAIGYLNGDEAALRELLLQTYGEDTWPTDTPFFRDLADTARRRPMLEWLARRTVGAVAHAECYAQSLRESCPGPVVVTRLAFTVPDLPPPPVPWNRMTIGVVGPPNVNKRIDQLILAVAASPIMRPCCRIRIIGEATEEARERLSRIARTARVADPEFTGWVTEEELRWRLRDVDVISCLRNPVLEGASASLVLALSSGRPTLVTDHGSYAEVPADAVLRCSPQHEARDVMRHLEQLMRDPTRGAGMGQRARALAVTRHAATPYVDALLPLLEEVVARRPEREARRHLASTLAGFGLPPDDPAVARAAAALAGLLTGT
jgi:glycosyltransferase involved in cell wall biosynthesis